MTRRIRPEVGSLISAPHGELMLPAAAVLLVGDWARLDDGSWSLRAELGLASLGAAGFSPGRDPDHDGVRALSALTSSVGGGVGKPSACSLTLAEGHLLMALFDFGQIALPELDAAFRDSSRRNAGLRLRALPGFQPLDAGEFARAPVGFCEPRFGWSGLIKSPAFEQAARAGLEALELGASSAWASALSRRDGARL